MPSSVALLQAVSFPLCLLGWLGGLACCALPLWKRTFFTGHNLLMRQRTVEGLWMSCTLPGPSKANCRLFVSAHKEVSLDVYAARILSISGLLLGLLALALHCLGSRCTNCLRGSGLKARLVAGSGLLSLVAGLALLLAVSWPAFILVTDYHHPLVTEVLDVALGPCIYLGWGSGALLVVGGALGGCRCCRGRGKGGSGGGRGKGSEDGNFL